MRAICTNLQFRLQRGKRIPRIAFSSRYLSKIPIHTQVSLALDLPLQNNAATGRIHTHWHEANEGLVSQFY